MKQQLLQAIKEAMKAKDRKKLDILRALKTQVDAYEKENKVEIDDAHISELAMQKVKQTTDAMMDFEKGGRQDLVNEAKTEILIYNEYILKQLTLEELDSIAKDVVAQLDTRNMKEVMNKVKVLAVGRATQKDVSIAVKKILKG